jgi:hypothetical protein
LERVGDGGVQEYYVFGGKRGGHGINILFFKYLILNIIY